VFRADVADRRQHGAERYAATVDIAQDDCSCLDRKPAARLVSVKRQVGNEVSPSTLMRRTRLKPYRTGEILQSLAGSTDLMRAAQAVKVNEI